MSFFVDIIVPYPLQNAFTYSVSKKEFDFLQHGFRVTVPFRNSKLITGIVFKKHKIQPKNYEPKEIEFIIDEKPIINDRQLKFFKWISNYYMCPLGQVIKIALPSLLLLKSESEIILTSKNDEVSLTNESQILYQHLKINNKISFKDIVKLLSKKNINNCIEELLNYSLIKLNEEVYDYYKPKKILKIRFNKSRAKDLFNNLKNKKSQQKVIDIAIKSEQNTFTIKDLISLTKVSRSTIDNLVKLGIFDKFYDEIDRQQFDYKNQINTKELSSHQDTALTNIQKSFLEKNVTLLHGVTSSGKTEIYVKLIEGYLKLNKQVLFLVPEIALTTQLISRLKLFFGDKLAVYHSRYSLEHRTEIWKKIINDDPKCRVVLGARSSIFLPFVKLGLVIVDEEHENAYKQFNPSPRYHARDSAIYLSAIHNSKTLLGSATPSLESYYNSITKKYGLVSLKKRFGNVSLPNVIIKDLKESLNKSDSSRSLSAFLVSQIKKKIDNDDQIMLFQNRRGYSPYLECSVCGFVFQCINCDVSLTFHRNNNEIKCHHCGYREENIGKCKKCNSTKILKKGLGTQQVEEEIKGIFPNFKTMRMDHDSTRKKNAFQKIIDDFENNEFKILVGTQMISKGLDFKNVTLVGVVNADSLIYFPDFRSQEKCFQLLSQVTGRAGRRNIQGQAIIQTYNPKHSIYKRIIENDYEGMFNEQLNQRLEFNYPPFTRLIKIILKHKDLNKLTKASNWFFELLNNNFVDQIIGPESPLVPRIKNKFIKNILIKIPVNKSLKKSKKILSKNIKSFHSVSIFRNIDISVDVDPNN
tara:strand:- start:22532 stop:24958 length:2427 start_codon:yes stop_codon:yes gene_type:complete